MRKSPGKLLEFYFINDLIIFTIIHTFPFIQVKLLLNLTCINFIEKI